MDFNEALEIIRDRDDLNEAVLTPQELAKLRDPILRKKAIDAALAKKNRKLNPNQVADFDETGRLTIKNMRDVTAASKIGATKIR